MDKIMLKVPILEGIILQLETEEMLYVENKKILDKEEERINKEYKTAILIEIFMQKVSRLENKEKMAELCQKFAETKIDDGLKIGDVFKLHLEECTENRLSYEISVNKGKDDKFLPDVGSAKIFQIRNAIKRNEEKVIINALQLFEDFFAKLIEGIIVKHPEKYLSDKTISYSDLIKTDVEELKIDLINKTVEAYMFNVIDSIEKICEKEGWRLNDYKEIWEDFVEVYQHRNILVHNMGQVNRKYLSNVAQRYKNVQCGAYLTLNAEILQKKIDVIIKFCYLLFYLAGETEQALDVLNDTAFEFLKKEKWEEALFAFQLLSKVKGVDQASKINCKINMLNAKKHIHSLDEVKNEIINLDVSGMDKKYVIAKELLLENNEQVTEMLDMSYPDVYNSYMIQTWPIFIEYRKTDEYKDFRMRHKEHFETYEYSPEKNIENKE